MASTLVFPDGIRLAELDEIPGPEPNRAAAWARVESANIVAGFTLAESTDTPFGFYAEINVDAPRIWAVFFELCKALLGPTATLVVSEIDYEPMPVGSARTLVLLSLLEPHRYQLAHDGWIQFGLIDQRADLLTEVFVAPTKHFKVWLNDEKLLRSILQSHAVPEADVLEFLDEYPRTTIRLPEDKISFHDHSRLVEHLEKEIGALL
ncbi:MAG: hypothetical protein GY847_11890 [Proteobacteria bacterium]|nr:hypothetical protein [Pseudomonadota bacterium]